MKSIYQNEKKSIKIFALTEMNRSYEFYQLDVFTEKKFAGNPLAVFPEAGGISSEEMQIIAREMNLSESVFVLSSEKALRRLRIFTPTRELPMAGHPVVGTWNLLAQLGFVQNAPENGNITIEQELGIGVLPVEIEFVGSRPAKVVMTQGEFTPGAIVDDRGVLNQIAESFGLTIDELALDSPVQTAGTGVNFLIVPVKSLASLEKCRPNTAKLQDLPADSPGEFSLFTRETIDGGDSEIHTRMFAPEFGIIEDPATGSAAGSLGGYLVHHGLLKGELKQHGSYNFIVEQGDFMQRPSRISLEITGQKNSVKRVRVGGASVVVAKGEIYL